MNATTNAMMMKLMLDRDDLRTANEQVQSAACSVRDEADRISEYVSKNLRTDPFFNYAEGLNRAMAGRCQAIAVLKRTLGLATEHAKDQVSSPNIADVFNEGEQEDWDRYVLGAQTLLGI